MQLPTIRGLIDRRILANFHVDPDSIARVLPPPFRPQLIRGRAIAGICLIRLKQLRPSILPLPWGFGSENAAHRIAVEWDDNGQTRQGVFIPRRDTNSRFNALAGGRLFPGVHHHATFTVVESGDYLSVAVISDDGGARVRVAGRITDKLPPTSLFASLEEASQFFAAGKLGYSPTRAAGHYDGLELDCRNWQVQPLAIETIESSFFQDATRFPSGTAEFDCALVMRGIEHQWHSRSEICCPTNASQ